MPVRRIEAETLRDSVLAVSGQLNLKAGGPAVPVMADRVGQFVIGKENLNAGRPGAVIAMHGEEFRRSVYIQVRRSRPLSVMDPFDFPAMEPNCTTRNSSTVATQSLLLMNSDFVVKQAENFARRLEREAGADLAAQVQLAWQLAYARRPSDQQTAAAVEFIQAQAAGFEEKPAGEGDGQISPQLEALASFCHALLSSNRFLYVD